MLQLPSNNEFFSKIYEVYYPKLLRFAKEYVVSQEDAENIVQDVFLYLWENIDRLESAKNRNAFLFTLVKNRTIDFLRKQISSENQKKRIQDDFLVEFNLKLNALTEFDNNQFTEQNIENIINDAIDSLPKRCKEIFILNRMEGMKYSEIAEKLEISPNTVETQMSIALKKLRVKLKDFDLIYLFII